MNWLRGANGNVDLRMRRLTVTELPSENRPPPVDRAEQPDVPLLSRPRPLHRYRWVLFLFVAGVLALALWVGWHIIRAWQYWMDQIMGA
jgi:hypothetical protein